MSAVFEEEFFTPAEIYGPNVTVLLWDTLIDQVFVC
jgi:hypothetical protein